MTEAGKDVMGRLGAQSEAVAYRVGSARDGPRTGQILFADYLTEVRQTVPAGSWANEIAAFLFLMESGVMGMNVHSDAAEDAVCCVAKAGEKAIFALAEPIAVALPALALVERESQRLSLEPKAALEQFVSLLQSEDGEALTGEEQKELLNACHRLFD